MYSSGPHSDPPEESAYDLFSRGMGFLRDGHPHQAAMLLGRAKLIEPDKASIREALGRALFGGEVLGEPGAGPLAERLFVGREVEVHAGRIVPDDPSDPPSREAQDRPRATTVSTRIIVPTKSVAAVTMGMP